MGLKQLKRLTAGVDKINQRLRNCVDIKAQRSHIGWHVAATHHRFDVAFNKGLLYHVHAVQLINRGRAAYVISLVHVRRRKWQYAMTEQRRIGSYA